MRSWLRFLAMLLAPVWAAGLYFGGQSFAIFINPSEFSQDFVSKWIGAPLVGGLTILLAVVAVGGATFGLSKLTAAWYDCVRELASDLPQPQLRSGRAEQTPGTLSIAELSGGELSKEK